MIKTILVPTSGTATDDAVFASAYAIARSQRAHLDFHHIRIPAGEASPYVPHVGFAMGTALKNALDQLRDQAEGRATAAARHVEEFCTAHNIRIAGQPVQLAAVSANWTVETGDAPRRLMTRARHCDLVAVGRSRDPDGLPPHFLETLLLRCGRPLLIAPVSPPDGSIGTVLVGWKETAEAARALAAAMPILVQAKRVVLASITEDSNAIPDDLCGLRRSLAWHGIDAELRPAPASERPTDRSLAAIAADEQADLLVMGGYGHGRMREVIFGGCTQAFLEQADLPVFILH